jgi:uncharacterized peroxidase-related enzyme
MNAEYKMTSAPITQETADGRAAEVLDKAKKQVGFIPNMYTGMVHSPGLLETYLDGYTLFREESGFSSQEQEVVFLAISRENGCDYCVAAHSFIADAKSGLAAEVTDAIRDGRPIPDAKLAALAGFTATMVRKRGLPAKVDVQAFLDAGYTERHILEVILAIAVKTISNYSNHIFHTEVDEVFAGRAWTATQAA